MVLVYMFDNLWTYIGYFAMHFPNDWSANRRPMAATHNTRNNYVLVLSPTTPLTANRVDAYRRASGLSARETCGQLQN